MDLSLLARYELDQVEPASIIWRGWRRAPGSRWLARLAQEIAARVRGPEETAPRSG